MNNEVIQKLVRLKNELEELDSSLRTINKRLLELEMIDEVSEYKSLYRKSSSDPSYHAKLEELEENEIIFEYKYLNKKCNRGFEYRAVLLADLSDILRGSYLNSPKNQKISGGINLELVNRFLNSAEPIELYSKGNKKNNSNENTKLLIKKSKCI